MRRNPGSIRTPAALAAALLALAPGGAMADWSFGSNGYSFSLSLEPLLAVPGSTALSPPTAPYSTPTSSAVRTEQGGARQEWSPGMVSGSSGKGTAPTGYSGSYYATGQGQSTSTWFWQNNWQNSQLKAATVLWGSMSDGETMAFYGGNSWAPLTGSAVLAAASEAGLAGSTFYVTVNALGGNYFSGVMGSREAAGTMEWVPLIVSQSNYVAESEPAPTSPWTNAPISAGPSAGGGSPVSPGLPGSPSSIAPAGPSGSPAEAPAHVLGSTPLGSLAALGGLAFLLAGRRRRGAEVASRA